MNFTIADFIEGKQFTQFTKSVAMSVKSKVHYI